MTKTLIKTTEQNSKSGFKHSHFSKAQLLVFALTFAVIGGIIIYKSFAATLVTTNCANLVSTVANAQAGTIVQVQGGDCNIQVNLQGINKDPANPVRIVPLDPINPPVFRGSGQADYPAMYIYGSNGLFIGSKLVFSNPNGKGVQVQKSDNITIFGNRFLNVGGTGVLVQGQAGEVNNNIIVSSNEFSGNGADVSIDPHGQLGTGLHSIYYGGNEGVTYGGKVINNWIHDQKNGPALQVGPASQGGLLVGFNTIQRVPIMNAATPDRIACIDIFSDFQGTSGVQVRGNVCVDSAGDGAHANMWVSKPPIANVENNAFDRIAIDPIIPTTYGGLVTLTKANNYEERLGDFKLGANGVPATDSPLVGKANNDSYLPATDFNGNPRTGRTLGAFEPAGGTTNPPPTVSLSSSPSTITTGQTSTLTWNSTNATSCTASGAWSGSKATSGSTSVTPTTTSTYGLSCSGAGGSSSANTTVTVNTVTTPKPSIPTNLKATPGDKQVTLSWTANPSSETVDNYQVYWSTDSTWSSAPQQNLTITGTSFTVTGLTNGTTYYFRVSAHNATGYGDWSASAVSATPIAPTSNVQGDLNGDGHVTITDMSILLSYFGTANSAADLNKDGSVNITDLSILLSHYGT